MELHINGNKAIFYKLTPYQIGTEFPVKRQAALYANAVDLKNQNEWNSQFRLDH